MPKLRLLHFSVFSACLLLQACGSAPPVKSTPAEPKPVPELTLNLPEQRCNCVEQKVLDYTPLERGFTALAAGEHIEAVQHFQRYQRLGSAAEASFEASIAIAYTSILPASPFYDPKEARKSYRRIRAIPIAGLKLHEQTILMRQSLETFIGMERKIVKLTEDNATLKENLEKREEALRRLRELALGQKARR